jgi:acylphosphatase
MIETRVHVWVSGRVQGVYFRYATRDEATRLGIRGWVRNLPDGRVEAVFEGGKEAVEGMIAFCRKGPEYARVSQVEVRTEDYTGRFQNFEIF